MERKASKVVGQPNGPEGSGEQIELFEYAEQTSWQFIAGSPNTHSLKNVVGASEMLGSTEGSSVGSKVGSSVGSKLGSLVTGDTLGWMGVSVGLFVRGDKLGWVGVCVGSEEG